MLPRLHPSNRGLWVSTFLSGSGADLVPFCDVNGALRDWMDQVWRRAEDRVWRQINNLEKLNYTKKIMKKRWRVS